MFYETEDITHEIRTTTVRMRLLRSSIVHYTFFSNADVDVEQYLENHFALIDLVGDTKHPLLIDASGLLNITSGARIKLKELELSSSISARAFVTSSLGHKLLVNFYMKVNKPALPNKMFSNYDEAVKWLLNYKAIKNIRSNSGLSESL